MPQIKNYARILIPTVFLSLCLMPFAHLTAAQETDFRILVNDRPFTGVFAAPQKQGHRLFLPALPIANLLGDHLSIETGSQLVRVRRQNGISAEFDASRRQVKENGAVTLSLSSTEAVPIPPYEEFLLLPTEVLIALFDVTVKIDSSKREILIRRGKISENQVKTIEKKEKAFDIYQADYDYRMDRHESSTAQNLTLNVSGFAGENKFNLLLNNSTGSRRNHFIQPRSGTLTVARSNGQELIAGNTSNGSNLPLLQTAMLGVKFSAPALGGRLSFFGGKPSSAWLNYFDDRAMRKTTRAGTFVVGGAFSFDEPNQLRSPGSLDKSVGVLYFRNNREEGLIVSGGASYTTGNATMRADLAAGSFSGSPNEYEERNFGFAASVSGNVRLTDQFAVQGHLLRVSERFKSPRSYQNYPQNTFGGGFSWRPLSWMSAAFSAGFSQRTDRSEFRNTSFSTTVNISPRNRNMPAVYFTHLQLGTNQFRSGAVTNLNITKDLSRWQFFSNLTRVKTVGAAATNIQIGARTGGIGNGFLQISQSFGSRGYYAGEADWRTSEILSKRMGFSAGIGYFRHADGRFVLTQRTSTLLQLPRRAALQFDFLKSANGYQFGISLRGSLIRPGSGEYFSASGFKPEKLSSIFGRVYQDINENGVFEPEIDRAEREVGIRLETGQTVKSDAEGFFRFDNVPGGEYKIALDPLTIRADLTILSNQEVNLTLLSAQKANIDFRLIRTGQITGSVWLDRNGNGRQDEGEPALPDVRVVAGNGHDTLTDSTGTFVIGDLNPGEYVIFIDEKTLPVNTKPASETQNIKVTAGKRTLAVDFPVVAKPAVIKNF